MLNATDRRFVQLPFTSFSLESPPLSRHLLRALFQMGMQNKSNGFSKRSIWRGRLCRRTRKTSRHPSESLAFALLSPRVLLTPHLSRIFLPICYQFSQPYLSPCVLKHAASATLPHLITFVSISATHEANCTCIEGKIFQHFFKIFQLEYSDI